MSNRSHMEWALCARRTWTRRGSAWLGLRARPGRGGGGSRGSGSGGIRRLRAKSRRLGRKGGGRRGLKGGRSLSLGKAGNHEYLLHLFFLEAMHRGGRRVFSHQTQAAP